MNYSSHILKRKTEVTDFPWYEDCWHWLQALQMHVKGQYTLPPAKGQEANDAKNAMQVQAMEFQSTQEAFINRTHELLSIYMEHWWSGPLLWINLTFLALLLGVMGWAYAKGIKCGESPWVATAWMPARFTGGADQDGALEQSGPIRCGHWALCHFRRRRDRRT